MAGGTQSEWRNMGNASFSGKETQMAFYPKHIASARSIQHHFGFCYKYYDGAILCEQEMLHIFVGLLKKSDVICGRKW